MKKYILCILLVIGVLVLVFKENKAQINSNVNTSIIIPDDTSSYSNELKLFLENSDKKYYTIKTYSDDAYILVSYEDKVFFYEDDGKVKMYDSTNEKQYILDGVEANSSDFIFDSDDNFIGITFTDEANGYVSYLKLDTNEKLYENEYNYIDFIGKKYLTANKYDKNGNQIGAYILDPYKEKVLLSKEMDTEDFYGFYDYGDNYISYEYANIIEIYDSNTLELLYKTNKANTFYENGDSKYMIGLDSNDNIIIYEDKYLLKLDKKGKVEKKSSQIIEGIDLLDKYVVNIKNKQLTITDIDNNIISIASLKNGGLDYYDYYKDDYKEGLYFLLFDNSVKFKDAYNACKNDSCKDVPLEELKDKEQYDTGYEYFFDYKTKKVSKTPIFVQIGGKEKPILYLYPKEKTNVIVTFDKQNNLTTTYPKYKDGWKVTAYPNGDLFDRDGKYYYGLYWEEKLVNKVNFDTGFYVTSDDAIEFLESKLSIIGLNDRERNEFIMYWLPILEKNSKSLVYFELTDEINKYNKINIYPKVDSLLRVTIHIKKVNEYTSIKEQVLPRFNRVGFSAVEWGGVTY